MGPPMTKTDTAPEGPIHEMIRVYRAQEGLKMRELADWIGIGASTLCRFERGKQLDAHSTLKLINWLFGMKS